MKEETKLNHSFTNHIFNNDATCLKDGTETAKCDNCVETNTRVREGSKLDHVFISYIYNNDATYQNDGTETATCERDSCEQTNTRIKNGSKLPDKIAPYGKIQILKNTWESFINTITFQLFYKEDLDVVITGVDSESGIRSIKYYLSKETISEEEITKIKSWVPYTSLRLNEEDKYIVYARIEDKAGNVSYINTDGFVIDKTVPKIKGIVNGATYCSDKVFTIDETNIKSITVNGEPINFDNGSYTLTASNTTYTVSVSDLAGNTESIIVKVNNGHNFSDFKANHDATCLKDGTKTAICECGETKTITDEGSAKGHRLSDFIIDEVATSEKEGLKHKHCSLCGENFYELITKLSPKLLNIGEITWSKSSTEDLKFIIDALIDDLMEIKVDGKTLGATAYSIKKDSKAIFLKIDYLKSLEVGIHDISFVYNTGRVNTIFEIESHATSDTKDDKEAVITQTSDDSNLDLWCIYALVSIVFIGILSKRKRQIEN